MISEKEAVDKADEYLLLYIGNLVSSGIPLFNKKERTWIVPIIRISSEKTNVLDKIKISENGQIIYAPSREKLIGLAKEMAKTLTH